MFSGLPVDDLLGDGLRLALGHGLGFQHGRLALDLGRGHVLRPQVARRGGGDVQGQVVGQLAEALGAGHKVGLAVQLQHDANAPAGVGV